MAGEQLLHGRPVEGPHHAERVGEIFILWHAVAGSVLDPFMPLEL